MEKMLKIIKYSLNIVFRRKLRTFLTSLGITIAVILLSFIIFGMKGLENALVSEFTSRFDPNNITIIKSGQFASMLQATEGSTKSSSEKDDSEKKKAVEVVNDEVLKQIEETGFVEEINPIISILSMDIYLGDEEEAYLDNSIIGMNTNGKNNFFVAYEKVTKDSNENLEIGEVYISNAMMLYYELENSDLVGKKIILKPSKASFLSSPSKTLIGKSYELEIVGIVDTGQDRNSVVMNLEQAERILADSGGFDNVEEMVENYGYQQVIVIAKEGKVEDAKKFIEEELGLTAFTSKDLLSFIETLTNGLTFALLLFAVVSGFVAGIGIVNTMVMSIYEQTREIGIIKAIGASNLQVLIIFLIQSAMIGFIGGVIGVAFVFVSIKILDPYIVEVLQSQGFILEKFFIADLQTIFSIVFASIFVGVIAGIYPSFRASKLDPVRALRYE